GFKDYRATGRVCGLALPAGLREADRLPEPVFTPATKVERGHDENIPFARMVELVGRARAEEARERSLALYARASAHAEARGLIPADRMCVFGARDDRLVWLHAPPTPASARFWLGEGGPPGGTPPSFDKQYVRDYLETLPWDKRPPGPALPAEVVARTREKYEEALGRLRGPARDGPTSTAPPLAGDRGHGAAKAAGASSVLSE